MGRKSSTFSRSLSSQSRELGTDKLYTGDDIVNKYAKGLPNPPLLWQALIRQDVFPINKIIEVFGKPDTCKTVMSLEFGRWFMNCGGRVVFLDAEEIPGDVAQSFYGDRLLDTDRFQWIEVDNSDEAQERIRMVIKAVQSEQEKDDIKCARPTLIILDSLPALVDKKTEKTFEKDGFGKEVVGHTAKAWSKPIAVIANMLKDSRCSLVIINHEHQNIGYGGLTTPGGRRIGFEKSLSIRTKKASVGKSSSSEFKNTYSKVITLKLRKNASGPSRTENKQIQQWPFRWQINPEKYWWDNGYAISHKISKYLKERGPLGPLRSITKNGFKFSTSGKVELDKGPGIRIADLFLDEHYETFREAFGVKKRTKIDLPEDAREARAAARRDSEQESSEVSDEETGS